MEHRYRRGERYRRVCSRVLHESQPKTTDARVFVTKHLDFSSRPSRSSVRDLPEVLGPPETPRAPRKPRKTLRSRSAANVAREILVTTPLNVGTSPNRAPDSIKRRPNVESQTEWIGRPVEARGRSTPCVRSAVEQWSDVHVAHCQSSRSHIRLKELKDEIKAFRECEGWEELRDKLRKNCRLELDEDGNIVEPEPDSTDKSRLVPVPYLSIA